MDSGGGGGGGAGGAGQAGSPGMVVNCPQIASYGAGGVGLAVPTTFQNPSVSYDGVHTGGQILPWVVVVEVDYSTPHHK